MQKVLKSRTEQEMLDLIVGTATADDNVRAVVLEGSRANPRAARDPFQDYDVIYGVTDLKPYRNNLEWLKRFGDLMILQMPDEMGDTPLLDYKFTYLMQFTDGNRIDLNLYSLDHLETYKFSSQSLLLLDKDGSRALPEPSDSDFYPAQPTRKEFLESCNEFLWVAPYVAKGLWRGELGFARHMFDTVLRVETFQMMDWYFGVKTDFKVSPGKYGKNYSKHLEPELYNLLLKSYDSGDIPRTWEALEVLSCLFRTVGKKVAQKFNFAYPDDEDRNISSYLNHIKCLPRNAKQIF